jgi:hypothetical protein
MAGLAGVKGNKEILMLKRLAISAAACAFAVTLAAPAVMACPGHDGAKTADKSEKPAKPVTVAKKDSKPAKTPKDSKKESKKVDKN